MFDPQGFLGGLGLPAAGKKADLVDRVTASMQEEGTAGGTPAP